VIGIIAVMIGILLPTMSKARQTASTTACLSNLRQLSLAALQYAGDYRGSFPSAQYTVIQVPWVYGYNWDYTFIRNTATGEQTISPGLLWTGRTNLRVQQCPSYDGKSATVSDPFTGYNYNTSYIGRGQNEGIEAPARVTQVRRPSETALFGDAGATQLGTNKFMRSPLRSPSETAALSADARINGAQGFRHNNNRATNVAFCDGTRRITLGALHRRPCGGGAHGIFIERQLALRPGVITAGPSASSERRRRHQRCAASRTACRCWSTARNLSPCWRRRTGVRSRS